MLFSRRITEKREDYLTDVLAELVAKYKKRDNVDAIVCCCNKEHRFYISNGHLCGAYPAPKTGNELWLDIIIDGPISDELKKEIESDEEKYNNPTFRWKSGVDLVITLSSREDFKEFKTEEIYADKEKFEKENWYDIWNIRHLYVSNILYDKDSYYKYLSRQFIDFESDDKNKIDLNYEKVENKIKEYK